MHGRLFLFASALALGMLGAGCTPHSDWMRETETPAASTAPPDKAQVIFVRPSHFALLAGFTVIDGQGHFLGESLAMSHFSALLPPGEHVLIAYGTSDPIARSDAMKATLAPGRTYFVAVEPTMGGVDITGITPRTENWAHVTEWIRDTKPLVPDVAAGQAHLDEDKADTMDEVEAGKKHLGEDPDEEALTTIVAADGVQ
jgi:hypothetical protein